MRFQSLLPLYVVWLMMASGVEAQLIKIVPKSAAKEGPQAPAPRPAPHIPMAAPEGPEEASLQTLIEVDILSPGILGDPSAQHWGKLFEDYGASVRVRNGRDVNSGVTEKVRGSLRFVTASGLLTRDGVLKFGEHSFQLDETERVQEWLDELKTYGAQGTPTGKPLWGLSRAQFAIVNEQMTLPLTVEVPGKSLPGLVKALQDDSELPVRLATVTETWLKDAAHDRPITVSLSGFSTGTGLAIALNELGAGLRPVRTPAGKIEYEILPLDQLTDPWPMGWAPADATPRDLITPNLFKQGVVGFEPSPLVEVLSAIQLESKTPIVIDTYRSLAKKIDVHTIQVSYPSKKVAWALVVSHCVRQSGLYNHYRQDEAGRGFVLVAPFEPKAAKRE